MKIKSQEQENSLRVQNVERPRRNEPVTPVKSVLSVGAEDLEKLQKVRAGEMLLNQAVYANQKSRQMQEEARERAKEREESRQVRDRAQLEGRPAEPLKEEKAAWAEEIQKLLKLLIQWEPPPGQSLHAAMAELQKLYQEIYKSILENFSGELQQVCLLRLKEEMLRAIEKAMKADLKELAAFLKDAGEDGGLPGIEASLYHQATQKRLSAADGRALVRQYQTGGPFLAKFPEMAAASQNGYIYKKGGTNSISVDDFYSRTSEKGAGDFLTGGASLERSLIGLSKEESLGRAAVAKTMGSRELQSAERFASYMNLEGARLPEAAISARNEEMLGVMMGTVYVKTAVFLQQSRVGRDLSGLIQDAVDRFVRNRLLNVSSQLKTQNARQEGGLDYREISRASSQMQKTYQKTGDFRSSLLKGIKTAYERFLKKQEDSGFSSLGRYQKGVGFFGGLTGGNPEPDMRRGLMFLREEWNRFIQAMQWEKRAGMKLDGDFVREGLLLAGILGKGKGAQTEEVQEEQALSVLRASFFAMCAGAALLVAAGAAGITSLPILGGGLLLTVVGGAVHVRSRKK